MKAISAQNADNRGGGLLRGPYRYRYLLRSGRMISLPKFVWRHLDPQRRQLRLRSETDGAR